MSQSKTQITQTTPPTCDDNKTQPDIHESTSVANAASPSQEQEKIQKQRLQLYNSLFDQEKDKDICDKTRLHLASSLNYSLYTFLHLCDNHWVLAMIDIESLNNIQEKYGIQNAQNKLNQIGTTIYNFCQNIPSKLKGFKCTGNDLIDIGEDDDHGEYKYDYNYNLFCMLMYCYPELILCEKYILKLSKKIKQQTNENVFVGIAKMNDWETFSEWKQRAFKNLQNIKNSNNNDRRFFSDISIEYDNPHESSQDQDEKKQHGQDGAVLTKMTTFGNKEEFDAKMKEIANKEDYEWIVAIIAIDDYDSFVFSTSNDKKLISKEIAKMEKEMYHLFDIYGNSYGNGTNKMKYFGYKLGRMDEFGLMLYDSKDRSKCFVPGHEIIETFQEKVATKCLFSVSIGCSRLIEDDLGFSDDWYQRAYDNLKQAKKSGANGVCFGISDDHNDDSHNTEAEIKLNETNIDDAIKRKSLDAIDVC